MLLPCIGLRIVLDASCARQTVLILLLLLRMGEKTKARGRIIGISGGMGPEAAVELFKRIIEKTPIHKDQDHLRVIIYNNPGITLKS